MPTGVTILPGARAGAVALPPSKSHLHRLMVARFLAGERSAGEVYCPSSQAEDILATRECLQALAGAEASPVLRCRESGSTLRFLLPVAMTLRSQALFLAEGGLRRRPVAPFLELLEDHGVRCTPAAPESVFPLRLEGRLQPGDFALRGDISSQFVTGLLLALPMLGARSVIRLTSPLESRGYVEMTLRLLREFRIEIAECQDGYSVPGGQRYIQPAALLPEPDWSGAVFWLAMNRLGSRIALPAMPETSCQPDSRFPEMLAHLGASMDVTQCPDSFPALAAAAAGVQAVTRFTGVRRLRLKESDRLAAMAELLERTGVAVDIGEESFTVHGIGPHLRGNVTIDPKGDHRIAMAAAVVATVADGPVTILQPQCVRKSYPGFFSQFQQLICL